MSTTLYSVYFPPCFFYSIFLAPLRYDPDPSSTLPIPKRVLVIGGGPTGLVALRNLIERGHFEHVELYERRDDVGGVWYFEENNEARWPSPAYKGLVGNVLPEFLTFSGFPFPEPPSTPNQPFPTLVETHDYLRAFAEPYVKSGAIKLNREVVRVVELRDEGLEELKRRGLAKHAKWWRGPQPYAGKKALVVGNANSSNDITTQLVSVTDGLVYQSIRRPVFHLYPSLPNERIHKVAPVSKYIPKSTETGDKFDALLTDGMLLTDLDIVQVGTGYRPFPNFLPVFGHSPADEGELMPIVYENTFPQRVPSLHRLILYAYNPTLSFMGAPMTYTPFTIADVVSTWLALAWRGEASYPDTPEGRLVFEKERLEAIAKWRSEMDNPSSLMVFSVLGPSEQEYAASLKADIVQARPELEGVLPVWSDERTALRDAMYQKKFEALKYTKAQAGKVASS
ncbi:hypothetical protein BDZ97DRAFT_1753585 [Flammula alnicola]|nr:hypothetical protein BDZ97DRAFT_1753585 [Flammula alnicola]